MLRSVLISLSKSAWAYRLLTRWTLSQRAASRLVAGDTIQDALTVVRALREKWIDATLLDQLMDGETLP